MGIKPENYLLIKKLLYKVLGNKCSYCGSKEKLELDHIDPNGVMRHDVSRSKREWEWFAAVISGNLQILCQQCNQTKRDSRRIYHIRAEAIL